MTIIGRTGFAFSLDLMVAFIAMLLMLSLMVMQFQLTKEEQLASLERLSLQERAIFLIDSMVKNRNEQQPLLGSAVYDGKRHRILQNQLDPEMLFSAREANLGKASVSSISLSGKTLVFFPAEERDCIALDRIVLVNGIAGRLEAVVCEN